MHFVNLGDVTQEKFKDASDDMPVTMGAIMGDFALSY